MKGLIAFLFFCPLLSIAQTPAPGPAGVMPDWEVGQEAVALGKHVQVIAGLLSQLRPQEWVSQGAPDAYQAQLKEATQANTYLGRQAQILAGDPAKLSVALDTFFRLDYLRSLLDSLMAGTRRYQNPGLADLLQAAINQNRASREKLEEYVRELSVQREQEWEIANREAQRCRGFLAKQPAARPKKTSTPPAPKAPPESRQ